MSSHDMQMYQKEIERLEANIIELQDLAYLYKEEMVYDRAVKLVGEVGDSIPRGNLTQFINAIDTGFTNVELTFFQQEFSKAFKSTIMEMANTEPLTLWNLPVEIKNRFTGKSKNIFLIKVYPKKNNEPKTADYLTDIKMDSFSKNSQYVIALNDEVYWVCGQRISDKIKITPESTQFAELSFTSTVG